MKTHLLKTFLLFIFTVYTSIASAQISVSLSFSGFNGYNVSCFGGTNGWITATPSGGTSPYTYLWSNSATTQTINNIAASYYVVTVTDASSNTATADVTMREPTQLTVTAAKSSYPNGYNVSCYQCFNGSITITPSGGVASYSFLWSDGPTTQNRSSIGGGNYVVTVTDANSCIKATEVSMAEPARDDWTMLGNSGSNPATQYIGTSDNKDLVFKTNGIERMRIGTNGGITTDRIRQLPGDSIIHWGDSSIWVNTFSNRLYGDDGNRGISLGKYATGTSAHSVALGTSIVAGAPNAIAIGSGIPWVGNLWNTIPNSLMIGFNSFWPTLFVSPAPGPGNYTIGNVGIGTTSPLERLQIGNEFVIHDGGNKVIARNFYYGGSPVLNRRIGIGKSSAIYFGDGELNFRTAGTGNQGDEIAWNEAMTITSNGHIGIGTTSPLAFNDGSPGTSVLMHLKGNSPTIRLQNTTTPDVSDFVITSTNGMGRLISNKGVAIFINALGESNNTTPENFFAVLSNHGSFSSPVEELFRVNKDGVVSIGTSSIPDISYKLYVKGGIKTEKIKVELCSSGSWCDYVFDKDYDLMSLSELEKFINKNKHLPEIPTDAEVTSNGIDVAEMDAKLLKKIEELTLYVIDLQKQIDDFKQDK